MWVEKLRSSVAHVGVPSLILFGSIAATLTALAIAISPALLAAISPTILVTVFYALHRSTKERKAECAGELSLRGDHVYVGDRVVAKRSALRSAVVVPHAREGTLVRLARGRSQVDLLVRGVAEGRAAVEELRFDAAHATASFVVRSRDVDAYRKRLKYVVLSVLAPILMFFAAGVLHSAAMAIAAMFGFVAMLVTALTLALSRTCVVGTDGILFGGVGKKEFIPLASVGEVEIDTIDLALGNQARVVRLYDKGGLVLREILVDALKNGPFQEGIHASIDARAQALAERIREAQEIAATGGAVDDRALAREAREPGDWVASLRALSRGRATFRGGEPPTEEALLALVEDPTAPAWKRAAAAIAASGRSTAHERLRVVSAASADPQLRVALEAAADEDEAQMASALEELSKKASGPG
ncbi:MAG: hypothetical protein JNL79_16455 [Myxococcales bacterium]|nr:hypothetical protein [Myxococcales bacterium]